MAKNLFLEEYEFVQQNFYNMFNSKIQTYSFNEKILDNPKNLDIIVNILEKGKGDILFIAPTGSGKNFSTYSAIEKIGKDNTLTIVPAHVQARQCEVQYDAKSYYGENGTIKVVDKNGYVSFKKGRQIGNKKHSSVSRYAVYDSLQKAFDDMKNHNVLITDEAHQIVDAENYRPKAIKKIEELSQFYNKRIYMTATPDVLMYMHFDIVINFEGEKNNFYNKIKAIHSEGNTMNSLKHIIKEKIKENKIPLIRENNGERINEIREYFGNDYRVGFITSSEKGFAIMEEDGSIVYDNSFTNSLINNSQLDTKNYDIFICSCVLDQGINIVDTNDEKDISNVVMIYDCFKKIHFRIDSFKQFFARVRKDYGEAIILLGKEQEPFESSFEEIVRKEMSRLYRRLDYLEKSKQDFDFKNPIDRQYYLNQLEFKDINNKSDNNYIDCDDNFNLTINYKKLYKFIYDTYNNYLFYNIEKLFDIFNNFSIEVMEEVDDNDKKITKNDKEKIKEAVENIDINTIDEMSDRKMKKDILKDTSTKTKSKYDYFKSAGLSNKEIINVLQSTNKEIKELEDKLFSQSLDYISIKDLDKLIELHNNDKKTAKTTSSHIINAIVKNSRFKKILKDSKVVKEFKKSSCQSFDEFLEYRQYVYINNMIKNKEINKIISKGGNEQIIIVNMNLTNRMLSEDLIKEVINELNFNLETLYTFDKDSKKVEKFISHIYNVDSYNKIRDLRTKF